jgi:hypothetical protein
LYRKLIPNGYVLLSEAAPKYGTTENALRLLAWRGKVRAVKVRGLICINVADYEALFAPEPYPSRPRAA